MGEENGLRKNNPLKKAPKRRVSPSTMVVIAIVISLLFAIYAYTLLQQAHNKSTVSYSTSEEQAPLEASELLLFAEPNSPVARIQIKIDKEECYTFFEDICTINELLSLSQRFEVAKMLREHRTYLDIAEKTGASTATISRVNRSLNYGNDGYDMVFARMAASETNEA